MSKLIEAFNVEVKSQYSPSSDYDVFKDKELLDSFRIRILESLSNKGLFKQSISSEVINDEINEMCRGYDISSQERNYLFNLVDNEVNGFGPLTELLKDNNISEIMVNNPKEIFIELDGKIQRDDSVSFINDEHIVRTIERLLSESGKSIDVNNPMVDARLVDGSRINAVIPPLSKSPVITIRKFRSNVEDMDTLVGNGTLTPYMARFLEACVKAKLNIIVSGNTGSGKTTLLNILSSFIDNDERIISIEDALELNLKQNNVVSLETKVSNYDGLGEITIRDLVRNSLRMRPDRIIIGEVRGVEAFDLLQAMNTGQDGSLTTLHANSSRDALRRLETMVLMDSAQAPIQAIREYIDNAIDIVVHMSRMRDGKRKITNISEVVGVKNGELIVNSIFDFTVKGINKNGEVDGEFVLRKYVPKCLEKIKSSGIKELNSMFNFKKK